MKKWQPAIELYQEALKYYPDAFEPNHRLAVAYSYSCKFQNFHCEEGSALIEKLTIQFPDKNSHFRAMDSIFSKHKTTPIILSK